MWSTTIGSFITRVSCHTKSYTIIYFIICLFISQPIIFGVWNFLYSSGVPSGGDPADHVFQILKIMKTGNPLISYTQFPDLNRTESSGIQYGFYPSLLHIVIGGLTFIATDGHVSFSSVVSIMQAFMFTIYIIGIIAYAFLLKVIIDRLINFNPKLIRYNLNEVKYRVAYYGLLTLAFGLFIYSTAPIVKTFRDGGYGEIFAMWCILPFYLSFMIKKNWFICGILLAVIASTHNLAFAMAVAVTISYFFSLVVSNKFGSIKKSKVFVITFLLFSIPAIIFFYYPVAVAKINSATGVEGGWSKSDEIQLIKPNLYYAGLIAAIFLLFIDYKRLIWLVIWTLIYLAVFFGSDLFAERFGRELTIPYGLMVGIAATMATYNVIFVRYAKYRLKKEAIDDSQKYLHNNAKILDTKKKQVLAVVMVAVIVLPLSYGYFNDRFSDYTDKTTLNYYTKAFAESNTYFLTVHPNVASDYKLLDGKGNIVLFGINPWLKPVVYPKFGVLWVMSKDDEMHLSSGDRIVNNRLRSILEDPNSKQALIATKLYNIDYIYISDFLPDRWYEESDLKENSTLTGFQVDSHSNYIHLEKQFIGKNREHLRVYSVDRSKVNEDLLK